MPKPKAEYPDPDVKKRYESGSVLGGEGGFSLFGGNKKKKDEDASGIGVNSFLWRASLDTLAFMPIASADPFGGVILTDWYSPPNAPNERFKVNLYILDRQLRADGVRVSVFRQARDGGQWHDSGVSPETAAQLEDTILTRARQLNIAQRASQ
ncbi:MAG TPA: DUF3576 domain-containing protein [Azospirillaceae bacterium]|nr:DUF3576 domain-containing protein [Azospirillaceae bacterium]